MGLTLNSPNGVRALTESEKESVRKDLNVVSVDPVTGALVSAGGNFVGGIASAKTYMPVGDSNSMRIFDSFTGATLNASGGVGTVTLGSARNLLVGTNIVVYKAGQQRSYFGRMTVAERVSDTVYRYTYSGPDSVAGETVAVAFGSHLTDNGFVLWMLAYLDQRLTMLGNGAVGGETAAETLARLDSYVIALKPDLVTVMLGTNDSVFGRSSTDIIADMVQIFAKLRAEGIRIIALTPPPRASGNNVQNATLRDVAAYVRAECARYPLQMVCVDAHQIGADQFDANTSAAANQLHDGTHTAPDYARKMGKAAALIGSPWVAPAINRITSVADYKANTPASGNVVANSLFVDSNADGTADGTTIAYSGASGTPTVIASPSGIGNMQRIAITAAAAGNSCNITQSSVHAQMVAGRKYRFLARAHVSDGALVRAMLMGMDITAGGLSYILRGVTAFTGVTNLIAMSEDLPGLLFATDWFVAPEGLTVATPRFQFIFSAAGSVVVGVSEMFTQELIA